MWRSIELREFVAALRRSTRFHKIITIVTPRRQYSSSLPGANYTNAIKLDSSYKRGTL